MGRKKDAFCYYLFIAGLSLAALARFVFMWWKLKETKKLAVGLLDFYTATASKLRDFRESDFYRQRQDTICWAAVSVMNSSWGNVKAEEMGLLATLVRESAPRTIFEFGTFNGYSCMHLAVNAPGAAVYTLDLPESGNVVTPENLSSRHAYDDIKTIEECRRHSVGSLCKRSGCGNITQLFGDSLTYDVSRFYGMVDFCFIDACHSYAYVKKDTENAMKMLSPKGIIVWHDYNVEHYDVFRLLNSLAKEIKLFRVENTSLAVYFNGE